MSDVKLAVFSPYDERLVDEVPVSDEAAAMKALSLAHATFQARSHWLPVYERKAILERFYQLFSAKKDHLVDIAIAEGGKPRWDSEIECDRALQGVKIAIEEISHLTGQEIPMRQTPGSLQRFAMTYREPVGVVLAISAFNHPLNLVIHQVIPAIAVGAPVVIKPASTTPLSCFNIMKLLYEAGLPESWCQAIVCSNEVAEHMVQSPLISHLNFVGSAAIGWHLRSQLQPGVECALEHGGAAPVIVEADADLELAVSLLVKGGFYHAGQVCVSVQRIFAHYKISKTLAKQLAKQAQNLGVGDPNLHDTDVGPLIAKKEVNRVHQWVQEAVAGGAKLLCGGHKISSTTYAPTVLLDPPSDSHVACEEVFGPVVCIFSYKDREQAIMQANRPGFCFQAAVFTKDIDIALECVQKLDATAVMVNDSTTFRVDWMPFGGRKKSGLSMGGIPNTMRHLTFEKMLLLRSGAL